MDLVRHRLVTSTPHLGASTVEAQVKVAREIAELFVEFSQNASLVGAVVFKIISVTGLKTSFLKYFFVCITICD